MTGPKIAKERTYRTVDGRHVAEGDPDAAFLVAAEGDELPDEEVTGKQASKPADKAVHSAENKGK